jgi:hypothetical protein
MKWLMKWLDPVVCRMAREYLEQGHPFEAARHLLDSPHCTHRTAKTMLVEISGQLVELARIAEQAVDITAAWKAIEMANKCVELHGEAAIMRNRVQRQKDEQDQQKEEQDQRRKSHEKRFKQAACLAEEGHLRSAMELLDQTSDRPDAQRLKRNLKQQQSRFERYLRECGELLENGDVTAARVRLDKARAIDATDPHLLKLEQSLRDAVADQPAQPRRPTTPSQPLRDRTSFALADHALIVSLPEIVLGNPLGESVQVPIQARIHKRHALIVRDHQCYRVIPLADCDVSVNGNPVYGDRDLDDGDVVQLENEHCEWRFRRPVSDSTTALLEQVQPGGSAVHTPDGSQFRRVVLAGDEIHIGRTPPAHLVVPHLPCESLVLTWTDDGLVMRADGASVTVDGDVSTNVVQIPSCLEISADIDEAERLGREFVGDGALDELRLEVINPFAPQRLGLF